MPFDWHGLTVAATNENEQIDYFHPTDPRIPLVHFGKEPRNGSVVCDTEAKGQAPDRKRHARLHTMLRIINVPPHGGGANAVAWNCTRTGKGDGYGGYIFDRASAKSRPKTSSGPTTPGVDRAARADQEKLRQQKAAGINANTNLTVLARGGGKPSPSQRGVGPNPERSVQADLQRPVSRDSGSELLAIVSHSAGGPFHPGVPKDPHKLGRDGDGHPCNALHLSTEALFIRPTNTAEDGPMLFEDEYLEGDDLDVVTKVHCAFDEDTGLWRWWGTAPEEDGNPFPEPPTPITPPKDPPPPTTPTDPDPPTTPRGGQPPPLPPIPPPVPSTPAQPIAVRQGSESRIATRVDHTRRWLEMSVAAMSFRAAPWGTGFPLLTQSKGHDRRPWNADAPTVLRLVTFGNQGRLGNGFSTYTQAPKSARYEGGTGSGGLWFLPPEVGGEDYAADFAPGNRSLSSSFLGIGPGVSLAFGSPDVTVGGIRDGWSMRDSAAEIVFGEHSAAGVRTDRITFEAGGSIALAAGDVTISAGFLEVSVETGITASTTQTQGFGPLTKAVSRITVVGTDNDTVTLPAVAVGRMVVVANDDAAQTLQVFPASGTEIDNLTADVSTTIPAGERTTFFGTASSHWISLEST